MIERDAFRKAMDRIASEKGDFALFALVMRADSSGRWDLLVSASWLEEGKLKAASEFVELLGKEIGTDMLSELARVAVIRGDDPKLQSLKDIPASDDPVVLGSSLFLDVPIDQAIVFRSRSSSAAMRVSDQSAPTANTTNPHAASSDVISGNRG